MQIRLARSRFVGTDADMVPPHCVAVLKIEADQALILPTLTLNSEARHAVVAGEVSAHDCRLALWTKRCRWATESLQWVPVSWLSACPGELTVPTQQSLRQVAKAYGVTAPRHTDESTRMLPAAYKNEAKTRLALV